MVGHIRLTVRRRCASQCLQRQGHSNLAAEQIWSKHDNPQSDEPHGRTGRMRLRTKTNPANSWDNFCS